MNIKFFLFCTSFLLYSSLYLSDFESRYSTSNPSSVSNSECYYSDSDSDGCSSCLSEETKPAFDQHWLEITRVQLATWLGKDLDPASLLDKNKKHEPASSLFRVDASGVPVVRQGFHRGGAVFAHEEYKARIAAIHLSVTTHCHRERPEPGHHLKIGATRIVAVAAAKPAVPFSPAVFTKVPTGEAPVVACLAPLAVVAAIIAERSMARR